MDRSAEREGIVLEELRGSQVKVLLLADSEQSEDREGCGSGGRNLEVTARDEIGVAQGNRVKVKHRPRSFLKLALIVFGIPAVLLLSALGLGTLLSRVFFAGAYERLFQSGAAGLALAVSAGGLVIYDRRLAAGDSPRSEVIELLEE